jgi:hypothetical protein
MQPIRFFVGFISLAITGMGTVYLYNAQTAERLCADALMDSIDPSYKLPAKVLEAKCAPLHAHARLADKLLDSIGK